MGTSSVPWTVVPLASKKNAPAVSPAHGPPSAPMVPATCRPDLNTYWSRVVRGQYPPPMVDTGIARARVLAAFRAVRPLPADHAR